MVASGIALALWRSMFAALVASRNLRDCRLRQFCDLVFETAQLCRFTLVFAEWRKDMIESDLLDRIPRKGLEPKELLLRVELIHHVCVVDQAAQVSI